MSAVKFQLNQTIVDLDISSCRKRGNDTGGSDLTRHVLALAGVPSPEVNLGVYVVFPCTHEHLLTFCL